MIVVSEVRLPVAGPQGCKRDDGKSRRRGEIARTTPVQFREADAISSFLRSHNYRAYWSLSDSKYAGTGLLVRRDRMQPSSLRFSLCTDGPPRLCFYLFIESCSTGVVLKLRHA